jgi:hypothetical protein
MFFTNYFAKLAHNVPVIYTLPAANRAAGNVAEFCVGMAQP